MTKGDTLGKHGLLFRDKLCQYIGVEGIEFMSARAKAALCSGRSTGNSISRIMGMLTTLEYGNKGIELPFPCYLMCSTMPRAVETISWDLLPFPINPMSNLNPLDKGDFSGLELEDIKTKDPGWYSKLEADPFRTR